MVASRTIPFVCGLLMSINFIIFWAIPIGGMGATWKYLFKGALLPIYDAIDRNIFLRKIAANYIYSNPIHADYFATSLLLLTSSFISLSIIFYWQFTAGYLPWWLIAAYYCSWVGIGGRMMGAAYALAHKEGHNQNLYKKWFREWFGHVFENHLGLFFGNVPWNFTTSHIFIHHKLDGGSGDTFYEWDLDRTSLADFMLYVYRIFLHMIGYSSFKFFIAHGQKSRADLLQKGVIRYILFGGFLVLITRSLSFLFWIYIQPLLCMTYFLAFLNIGFHGFIEFDENGKSIPCVNATTIIDGDDDYFGEDDHMAHHYNAGVYYKDLPAHQATKLEEFKKYKASVFKGLSIVELSIFILLGLWDELAKHYVDYTGTMTKEEIKTMLKIRAQRKETSYECYEEYLKNPTAEARKSIGDLISNTSARLD